MWTHSTSLLRLSHSSIITEWGEATAVSLLTEVEPQHHHYWMRWSHSNIVAEVKPQQHHYWLWSESTTASLLTGVATTAPLLAGGSHSSVITDWGEATTASLLRLSHSGTNTDWAEATAASLLRWSQSSIITGWVDVIAASLLTELKPQGSSITDWGEATAVWLLNEVKPQQHRHWGEVTTASLLTVEWIYNSVITEVKPQQQHYWLGEATAASFLRWSHRILIIDWGEAMVESLLTEEKLQQHPYVMRQYHGTAASWLTEV